MALSIRTYTPADYDSLVELFHKAGKDSPSEELWGHAESERMVYLDPYIERFPETLFLAEVDGRLAGYLTGCPDSAEMPSEDDRISAAISKYRLILRPRSMRFFGRAALDYLRTLVRREARASGDVDDPRWPAHLHINVIPESRGAGAAAELMSAWLRWLTDAGSPGCYLQTLVENPRAVRFFEKSGFVAHGPTPLVMGARYEGKRVHQLTMVWSPPIVDGSRDERRTD